MTNSNNDIEELEELLTELEGQEARIVTPYSEEDDAVTRLMDAPLGDQDWMVQVTALDRRMMSTNQVLSELQTGKINTRTLVWRGGMDDWLPVSRIDELSRASAPPMQMPRPSAPPMNLQRPAFANLAPPPPPPAQASQPLWSGPPSAPLPPPPLAMSPPIGMSPGSFSANSFSPNVGMQQPSMGLPPPPMALTPPPPPPSVGYGLPKPVSVSLPSPPLAQGSQMSHGNTTRPVAIDFSDVAPENDRPLQSKRWVMALSAVAILAVFVTVYSLSSGGGESEAKATAAQPQAVSALQPASSAPKEKPSASPAPAAVAKAEAPVAAATAKPTEEEQEEERSEQGSSASSARQTAQARYAIRSENRRRMRNSNSSDDSASSDDAEESTPTRARATASRATARAEMAAATAPTSVAAEEVKEEAPSEPVAAADEVDEAPKSTSKASGSTFNRDAAKAALDEAAEQAKNCRPQGGPSGTGRVQVRYEPSGKVANVAILTSKFDNTTAGSCVRMLFRRAKVPEFTGQPVVVVNKSFEIP